MVPLSPRTRAHIETLFAQEDRPAAEKLLEHDCAETLPLLGGSTPESLERVRFAALKLSHGDLAALRDAVAWTAIDWRDVLVAAGFADDVHAHERWRP
jgi:hypothetical protein